MINQEFHKGKRKDLATHLLDRSLVILFAGKAPKRTGDQNYTFTPNRNFYYLTGVDKEKSVLVMVKYDNCLEEVLLIEKPNRRKESRIGQMMDLDQARELTGIPTIRYVDEMENCISELLNNRGTLVERDFGHVYFDFEAGAFDDPLDEAKIYVKTVQGRFPYLQVQNIHHQLCNLRVLKEPAEIEKIKRAIAITDEGIKNMMRRVQPGVMEYELEAGFDYALKVRGVRNPAFPSIVASGANATVLHYEDNNQMVDEDELVLVDVGAEYEYYCADISRTFPSSGRFTPRQRTLYGIVLKAQEETIKAMKPGQELEQLLDVTEAAMAEECQRIGLIKSADELSRYFFHGVSHYLGLDTHDVGARNVKLAPGMVLTVEPGLYIPEENIGIRIEDDVLITDHGHEVLSQGIIKTAEDIERFMQQST